MRLSKHDLFQMDDEWLKKLPAELLLEVSKRLLHDVKELQDRLNQSAGNSSRPPSREAPWEKEKARDPAAEKAEKAEEGAAAETDVAAETTEASTEGATPPPDRPSRRQGSGKPAVRAMAARRNWQ